jgi:hypothetical protein
MHGSYETPNNEADNTGTPEPNTPFPLPPRDINAQAVFAAVAGTSPLDLFVNRNRLCGHFRLTAGMPIRASF